MTTTLSRICLYKWLICSDAAFQSISGFWRNESGESSLLDWRLTTQMIEHVPLGQLPAHLEATDADSGEQNLLVVVDKADLTLLKQLQQFQQRAGHLSLRVVEWGETPLAAVLSMNAPDHALLSALQAPADDAESMELFITPSDLATYVVALSAWERACKANDGNSFAQTLPAFADAPIPWRKLLVSASAKSPQSPAANDNWVELVRLAAATNGNEAQAVSLEDPRNKSAQWTLTLSPIDGGPSTLAVFRVNDAAMGWRWPPQRRAPLQPARY